MILSGPRYNAIPHDKIVEMEIVRIQFGAELGAADFIPAEGVTIRFII
jgi:hypothetical protein